MKKLSLFVLLLLVTFTLIGCSGGLVGGGSGGGANSARDNGGSMTLTVNWPGVETSAAGKAIPSSAYSIKVNVCTPVTQSGTTQYMREVNASLIIRRNTSASSESVTINGIPAGSRTVIAQAYDGSAVEQAYGTQSVTITQGDNNSTATVTLSSGTFPYTIFGPGDITTPTSGGGGGGSSTSTKYFFVNNYGDGSISVLQEIITTTTSGGSSSSTYAASVAGTMTTGISKPCRGTFDTTGSYYYLVSGDGTTPYVYKVTPNTTTWSASATSVLYNQFPAGYCLQEILYDSGYLYVPYKRRSGELDVAGIYKINASSGAFAGSSEEIAGVWSVQIVGLYRISAGKFLVAYTDADSLYVAVCNDLGANLQIVTNKAANPGFVGGFLGQEMMYVCGLAMAGTSTVYVPGAGLGVGSVTKYTLNSNDSFTLVGQYLTANTEPNFRKALYNNTILYALSSCRSGISYVYYGTISSVRGAPIYGYSDSDMSDMAFSYDKARIYITDFGWEWPLGGNGGNKVWYKTLSDMNSAYTPITVGLRPFSIALKP